MKNELEVVPPLQPSSRSVVISPTEWDCLKDQARIFLNAKCLPAAITLPEQAMVVMMKGRELGIPPMASLSSIYLIKGTPAISAQLMLALCYRDLPRFSHQVLESTDKVARVKVRRPGNEWAEFSFSIDEAKQAQLLGRTDSNWSKYPKRMLLHRAVSFACRTECPDVVLGCYTPEEAEEIAERDVTPPLAPPAPPKWLPDIEPLSTAESFVKALWNAEGGQDQIYRKLKLYKEYGPKWAADALETQIAMMPLSEADKLPFEKGPENG